MKNYLYLFFLLVLFSSCKNERPEYFYDEQLVKLGDNPDWAAVDFDDSTWEENIDVVGQGVFWIRIKFELADIKDIQVDQGMMVGGSGSYQLWLDEKYLGQNGKLQTENKDEVPGTYHAFFDIPDSLLTEGTHVAAFRMTQQSDKIGQHLYFLIDNYFELTRAPLQTSKYMFLFAGAFLLAAVYFLFMFFSRPKEISPLLFSIVCVLFCSLLAMEYLKFFYLYEYPFQNTRMEIIGYLHISLAVLVPLFLMLQFSFPPKHILILMLILLGIIYYNDYNCHNSYDKVAKIHHKTMMIFSCLLTAYAVYKRKNGAKVAFAGVLFGYLLVHQLPHIENLRQFLPRFDISQFIAFVIIVLCMFYILTLKIREERLAYEASLVLSERLKNELLKKNIKPHFIMNTLTSLIDWVEEAPKEGVKFITALAGEFEILNEIADYKLVPIEQEIKLCKNHLKVMGYRKEITYKWEEWDIDMNEIIPPAIIHTAVENGVTHSIPNEEGVITFRLSFERNEKSKKYILHTIAEKRKESAIENTNKRGGTGLKYIRSRLQESYPDKWAISSQATRHGWETVFEIFV